MALDVDDEDTYEAMYEELSKCVQELIQGIAHLDSEIMKTKMDIEAVEANQMEFVSLEELKSTVFNSLRNMSSADKKEFFNGIIERVEIYPERLKNGRQVKSIKMKMPAMYAGREDAEEFMRTHDDSAYTIDEDAVEHYFLHNVKHDETVALLSKQNSADRITALLE
ncbi:MAG: hypothetical protein E7472_07255 [Ruminococcaceae bacterium]|nr:hypothetical protein [Oscillospiraceae bacterium]